MSDQIFWFATRSAGIICWFAAAASVMVGLLIPTRALGRRPTIPWLTDLHRYFGAMSVLFLLVHMATLWADSFINFTLADLLVPFMATVPGLSRWSLALGVIAAWFLFAIEGSSLIKDRMPPRAWHTVHLTSFGVLIAGAIHGLADGSDTDNRFLVAGTTSAAMAILILGAMRASRSLGDRKQRYDDELAYDDDGYGHEVPVDAGHQYDLELDADFDPVAYDYGRGQRPTTDVPVTSGARLLDTSQYDDPIIDEADPDDAAWLRRPPPQR